MSDGKLVNGIAVIGLGVRVPGASEPEGFWRNLRAGVESIVTLSPEELERRGVPEALRGQAGFVPAVAAPAHVQEFDAAFFGFSPREAEVMDPQLRLFLECAWTSIEDAGYDVSRIRGAVGVAAGVGASDYYSSHVQPNRQRLGSLNGMQIRLSNSSSALATMVSYKLDLRGPSFTVQTACSSSLVAVHLACQSLLNGECDLMLAGGVSIGNASGYVYQEGGILSRDGHCRAFDARANGTVPGSGVGVVVLKRLSEAVADHDLVHAVILGSAVNNDGASKAGFTAPSVMGHAKVTTEALAVAGVEADSIGYLEAHGTGTELGDPIEIEGLTMAFRETTRRSGFCSIGSVKTNIGHLDHAAGVVGLIKAVLALENGEIPPSLHFDRPNPKIDFESTPFRVAARLLEWRSHGAPRRAGVSSLGIGGTNAHVVLEEAPRPADERPRRAPELLLISARSEAARDEATARLALHLRTNPDIDLGDVAYTLHAGRKRFGFRRALVARSVADAVRALETRAGDEVLDGGGAGPEASLAFVFPGRSPKSSAAVAGIYRRFPAFRDAVDECCRALADLPGVDLRTILGVDGEVGERSEAAGAAVFLEDSALFVSEYALARLWMSWGCRPQALIGQGIGELVSAALAGILRLEDALSLAAFQARGPEDVARAVAGVALEKPHTRVYSSITGSWLGDEQARDPHYWGRLLETSPSFEERGARLAKTEGLALVDAAPSDIATLLRAAGRVWVEGISLDPAALHAGRPSRRVPLPGYPFERQRYWLDAPRERAASKPVTSTPVKKASVAEWLYVPCWRSSLSPRRRLDTAGSRLRCLVLDDGSPLSRALLGKLRRLGHELVEATSGREYRAPADGRCVVRPTEPSDYRRLVQHLAASGFVPDRVVFFRTGEEELGGTRGLESFLYASRALGESRSEGRVRLFLVSRGLESLGAGEEILPSRAMILALCPVIRQEYPSLTAAAIDVRPDGADAESVEGLAEGILAEVFRESDELLVALRNRWRHVLAYESVSPKLTSVGGPRLRQRGTYVITGGLGQLGIAIAEHLARGARANLVLLSRGGVPERSEWEDRLTEGGSGGDVARRIRAVLRLESLGSEVLVLSADVADPAQMAQAWEAIERRFGSVDGVIHAAGLLDRRTLCDLGRVTPEEIERQFRPKVDALPVLERLLEGRSVDFVLLMSSLSAVLGGVGYGVYAAANAFMDAFAAERQRRHRETREPRTDWISVNWDAWSGADTSGRGSGYGAELSRLALTPGEGLEALDLLLSLDPVPRFVVSTADLGIRIERWARLEEARGSDGPERPSRHPRPNLGSVFVAPGNEAEGKLAEIWGELLGVDRVGIHDNFFELGGSSLLAIQLVSEVERRFGVKIVTTSIFEGPTVHSFASLIASREAGVLAATEAEKGVVR